MSGGRLDEKTRPLVVKVVAVTFSALSLIRRRRFICLASERRRRNKRRSDYFIFSVAQPFFSSAISPVNSLFLLSFLFLFLVFLQTARDRDSKLGRESRYESRISPSQGLKYRRVRSRRFLLSCEWNGSRRAPGKKM